MRSILSRTGYWIGVGLLLAAIGGCASTTSGTAALTPDNVSQIRKGVTTRQEIEAIFGPSAMVSMMGNGKHMMHYSYSDTNVHANWMCYVPVLNWFAGGAEGESINRSLQVNLDPKDIVEDFQFNDGKTDIESRHGVFGNSVKSTPVPNQQ